MDRAGVARAPAVRIMVASRDLLAWEILMRDEVGRWKEQVESRRSGIEN